MNKMKFKPNNISPHTVYSIDKKKKFSISSKKNIQYVNCYQPKNNKKITLT